MAYSTIDESEEALAPPTEHIFVGSKASWYTIPDDGAERYDRFDPPFQKELDRWKREQERQSKE